MHGQRRGALLASTVFVIELVAQVVIDCLWSDPTEHDGIEGGHESPRGGCSHYAASDA